MITNFTHPADGSYFTLRSNDNVDVVTELGETFVPTLENEKIILEVLEIFREADIKVILYLNGGGPSLRASDERVAIWDDYVERKFAGDEHAAWMDLAQGYATRFSGLVDGYWVDALGSYPGTRAEIPAFIQMLRDTSENLAITANLDKDYITDDEGEFLYVDTDGLDDNNETDYKIIKYESTDALSDYTSGHITPLGQGAPPNSWAYEEFTIANIQDSSTSISTDYNKLVLKHMFLPMREKWSNERVDLIFGKDDALRFAKNITDAGGSVTFSTTNLYGLPMADELEILTHVNEQMSSDTPEVTEYARPQGAFLVGEAHIYPWYENEATTDEDYIIHAQTVDGQFLENSANPKKIGINSSETVARLKRNKGDHPSVSFTLPNPVTDLSSLKLNVDAYARIDTSELTSVAATITVSLTNSSLGETTYQQLTFTEGKTWQAFVIDFSAQTISDAVLSAGGYDQLSIGFALGDDSDDITNYYFDNLSGSINQNITQ